MATYLDSRRQGFEEMRHAALMRRDGAKPAEIARRLGIDVRRVYKAPKELRA